MQTGHKIAIAVVAVALIIVIGLIALTATSDKTTKINAAAGSTARATDEPTAEPTQTPAQDAQPDEEAQDEAQSDAVMYEGALAGLTEEEIGQLAMAEEQKHSDEADIESEEDLSADMDGVVD